MRATGLLSGRANLIPSNYDWYLRTHLMVLSKSHGAGSGCLDEGKSDRARPFLGITMKIIQLDLYQ
jgi:hypothetical protein